MISLHGMGGVSFDINLESVPHLYIYLESSIPGLFDDAVCLAPEVSDEAIKSRKSLRASVASTAF
jgi:hypothetical protein